MGDLKTAFRLPPEDIEITRSQILDCPLLQTRKKMLHQVDKRMQIVRDEIEVSNRNSLKLSSSSQVSQTVRYVLYLIIIIIHCWWMNYGCIGFFFVLIIPSRVRWDFCSKTKTSVLQFFLTPNCLFS